MWMREITHPALDMSGECMGRRPAAMHGLLPHGDEGKVTIVLYMEGESVPGRETLHVNTHNRERIQRP